jgi:arginase family enzyme
MNPAAEHNHLFSPLEGENADHSSHISFMGAPFVPVDSDDLSANGAPYVFIGAPFDEGNVGKPGCEDGAREFRVASLEMPSYWFEFNVDLDRKSVV